MNLIDLARALSRADYEDKAAMRTLVACAIDTCHSIEREQTSMRQATALRGAERKRVIDTALGKA